MPQPRTLSEPHFWIEVVDRPDLRLILHYGSERAIYLDGLPRGDDPMEQFRFSTQSVIRLVEFLNRQVLDSAQALVDAQWALKRIEDVRCVCPESDYCGQLSPLHHLRLAEWRQNVAGSAGRNRERTP